MSTKYNGPGSLVLHTKVHGNCSTGSKEEDFMAFFHIWARKPSSHVNSIILTHFISLYLKANKQNLIKG